MARRARSRVAARSLLPRRLHAAQSTAPMSLIRTSAVVYDILLMKAAAETTLAIAADPKRLGASDRHHRRAAHVGLGADASSTRAYDRARRRHLAPIAGAGRPKAQQEAACSQMRMLVALQLPRPRQRARAFVPRQVPRHGYGRARRRPIEVLQHPRRARRQTNRSQRFLAPLRRFKWVVYCKEPFAGPKQVLALSVALHPSRRHLKPSAGRLLIDGGVVVPLEGLSHRRSWPLEDR